MNLPNRCPVATHGLGNTERERQRSHPDGFRHLTRQQLKKTTRPNLTISIMKMLLYLTAAIAVCAAQNLGHIENLKAKSGDESVTLEWDFVKGDAAYRLHKYTLVTDNDFSEDIRCPADHCVHTVDYLEACKEHTFDLTPYFDDTINSGTVDGDTAATTGYTYDKPPNSPSNLRIVSEEELGTTLQWDAPTKNTVCVKSYKVCFRLDADPNPTCDTTEDTTVLLPGLQACGKYHVSVTPVTPTNAEGPKLEQDVTTGDGGRWTVIHTLRMRVNHIEAESKPNNVQLPVYKYILSIEMIYWL
ncbi:hypothetical protein Hamer_G001788, partial [Homarus americanus]